MGKSVPQQQDTACCGGPGERELHAHRPAGGDVVRAGLPQVVQREGRVEDASQELDVEKVTCV